jgi:membrane protein
MNSSPETPPPSRWKKYRDIFKQSASEWSEHQAQTLGAALAFYTVFSIAPLFLITVAMAGLLFGEEAARHQLFGQLNDLVGHQGAEAIQAIVAAANRPKAGAWATITAAGTLIIGAMSVFVQLQSSLNTIWNVRPKPGRGIRDFIHVRIISFAMIVGIGFLLLVSLIINASLAALGKFLHGYLPEQQVIWHGLDFLISLGVITVLFAMLFKVMPDVQVAWRDVWTGALLTAVLFNIGKFLLGFYLGRSTFASAYGAAGSIVIILMWVYYSSQIVFFGAEFTRIYAATCGSHVRPAPGTHFVAVQEIKTTESVEPKPPMKDATKEKMPLHESDKT